MKNIFLFLFFSAALCIQAKAQSPVAAFTATPISGCAPLVVQFTDQSTNNPTSWSWTLGNSPTPSTVQNPSTIYFTPGTYTITLTATNASGSNTITKTAFITVYALPTADFLSPDTVGCTPLVSHFTDLSTPGSGVINQWEWNFGDGNLSNIKNPTNTYTNPGSYNVVLKVTNNFGCSRTAVKSQYVRAGAPLQADFDYEIVPDCTVPISVAFTNTTTGSGTLSYNWNFGDATTSTATSPTHQYASSGSHTVTLNVTSDNGCTSQHVETVVTPAKHVIINAAAAGGCVNNNSSTFTSSVVPAPVSYLWNMGDGNTYNTPGVTHTYASPGTYNVTLTADFGSCTETDQVTVTILTKPVAAFNAPVRSSCAAPLTVNFQNNTTSGVSYLWNFGDGNTSTLIAPSHTYTSNGSYNVQLIATGANGCKDTLLIPNFVTVQPPSVTYTAPAGGCRNFTFSPVLTVNSVEPVTTYAWNFGDGNTANTANPTHVYTTIGTFTVTITITTTSGCTATYTSTVSVGEPIAIDFVANPTTVCGKEPIQFTSLLPPGVSIQSYLWDFGDGVTSSSPNPNYTYSTPGTYTVSLVVNYNNCLSTIIKNNYITILPPIAAFNITRTCTSRNTIQFNDLSVDALSWDWNFGDGNTSTATSPSHTYSTPGTYNVRLIVTNNTCKDTADLAVTIVSPNINLTVNKNFTCKYSPVTFTVTVDEPNNIAFYHWHVYGDNNFIRNGLTNFDFTYNDTGVYNVFVVATDVYGCTDTAYRPNFVTVYGPKANFGTNVFGGCEPLNVPFTDSSTTDGVHNITQWIWNFGDGPDQSLTAPFSHTYTSSGAYDIKLKVFDSYGCYDTLVRPAYINITSPKANFFSVDSFTCGGKNVTFTDASTGPVQNWLWDFGDGTTSTLQNPQHNYADTGTYTVTLTVSSVNCNNTIIKTNYIVRKNPVAKFGVSDSVSTCPPFNVHFSDSSYYVKSYAWNFGDGNTTTAQNPDNIYVIPGTFMARLIVTSEGGCTDTAYQKISVGGPYGTITYTPQSGCINLPVNFTANTTGATSFIWDYGDGNSLSTTDSLVSHTYPVRGDYIPRALFKDATGCVVPIEGAQIVHVEGAQALFAGNPLVLCDNGIVTFTDTSKTNSPSLTQQWSFGDGNTSTLQNPTNNYAASGFYTVRLIQTTALGCTDTLTKTNYIKIVKSPVITNISTGTNDTLCAPATFTFTPTLAADTSAITQWQWTFANGNTSSLQNPPAQTFTTPGTYTNTLTVTNSTGCTSTQNKNVVAYLPPTITISNDTTICRGTSAQLLVSGAQTYNWINTTTGLSCTNCSNPTASPLTDVTYTVRSFDGPCTVDRNITVKVLQPYTLVIPQKLDSACLGSSIRLLATGAPQYIWSPATGLSSTNVANPVATPTLTPTTTYYVTGKDSLNCFNQNDSVVIRVFNIPTVDAGNDTTINSGYSAQLNAIASPDVVSYLWNPGIGLSCTNCPNPIVTPTGNRAYVVRVTNNGGCTATDTVNIFTVCDGTNIYIPNTFSPNNDGMNDLFFIRGKGLFNVNWIRIFNRQGQAVFEKRNVAPNDPSAAWDGKYGGKNPIADTYTYMVEVVCNTSTILRFSGSITLIQ